MREATVITEVDIMTEAQRMQRMGVATGLCVSDEVSIDGLDTSATSTQALKLLKQLKSIPIGKGGSPVEFSTLKKQISVWVNADGVGSIVSQEGAKEIKLSGSQSISKTPAGKFIISGHEETPVPADALYLALLSEAAEEVQKKLTGTDNENRLKVFNTALSEGKKEPQKEGSATDAESMTVMRELGVIMHEVSLIQAAQNHKREKAAMDEKNAAYETRDGAAQKQYEIQKQIREITGERKKEDLSREETAALHKLQEESDAIDAAKTAAVETIGEDADRGKFDKQYAEVLERDARMRKIMDAHTALLKNVPPSPKGLAEYAKLVFSDGHGTSKTLLEREIAEVQKQIGELEKKEHKSNFITDLIGKLHETKTTLEGRIKLLEDAQDAGEESLWQGLFARMQQGELSKTDKDTVLKALEDPSPKNAREALSIALEANGYNKHKDNPDAFQKRVNELLEKWGLPFLLLGLDKLTELLESGEPSQ